MPSLVAARLVAPNIRPRRLSLKRLERLIFSIPLTSHCIAPVMLDRRRRPRGSSPKSDIRFSMAETEIQSAISKSGIAFHFSLTGRAARDHKRSPEKKNVEDINRDRGRLRHRPHPCKPPEPVAVQPG